MWSAKPHPLKISEIRFWLWPHQSIISYLVYCEQKTSYNIAHHSLSFLLLLGHFWHSKSSPYLHTSVLESVGIIWKRLSVERKGHTNCFVHNTLPGWWLTDEVTTRIWFQRFFKGWGLADHTNLIQKML